MKIAVTGGSGFIGRAVMSIGEEAGHEMLTFDRVGGNDVLGPLDTLDALQPKVVIHLAGVLGTHELFDDPETAVNVNVIGTLRILQWCRDNGAGYVGITMPPVFPSVYTATKVCADRLATAWHREFGIPVAKVRAFNAFGPGQKYGPGHPQKIIPTFAMHAWQGRPIPVWGDGTQTVDLLDVNQIARILIEACDHGDDATFDAGSGQAFTVNEIAAYVNKVVGSEAGLQRMPMRRGEEPTHIVATGDGWDRLSFKPRLNYLALQETVRSYQRQALGQ